MGVDSGGGGWVQVGGCSGVGAVQVRGDSVGGWVQVGGGGCSGVGGVHVRGDSVGGGFRWGGGLFRCGGCSCEGVSVGGWE